MDGSFQTLEKVAELHNRTRYRKSSETDRKRLFDTPIQPAGNFAIQRLLRSGALRAKLAVGQPADVREQEADKIAEEIMRMPEPARQRTCAGCDSGAAPCRACEDKATIAERKAADHASQAQTDSVSASLVESLGSGQSLDPEARAFFEPRFGADLGHVRVHTDASAADSAHALSAQAYTVGRDVVFSAGQYKPGSNEGRKLLSHELTHVIQQAHGQGTFLQRQPSSAPAAQPVIGLGSSGAAVEELQHRLNQAGAAPLLDADGIFGQRTRSALIAFQQSHGLVADGIAGPLTWAALGGTPTGPSEAPGAVTTTGAFEQTTMMDSTFQETAEASEETWFDLAACYRQRRECYDCCEKLHSSPWQKDNQRNCKRDCDGAFLRCRQDGTFPFICKA